MGPALEESAATPTLRAVSSPRPVDTPLRPFPRITIVDDCADDLFLLLRQLRHLGVACPVATFTDSLEAMAFLRQRAVATGPANLPELLFLDLHLPGATGFSILCWLREHEALRHLKVVIISGTSDPGDVALATALSADAYLSKQSPIGSLVQVLARCVPDLIPSESTARYLPVHAGPASDPPFPRSGP